MVSSDDSLATPPPPPPPAGSGPYFEIPTRVHAPNDSRLLKTMEKILKNRWAVVGVLIVFVALGIWCWKTLPIEAYPELADPQIRVITLFPGKGPEEVERLVTIPLEKELNGIPGQKSLRSISLYGLSVITSVFQSHSSIPVIRSQALERISKASIPQSVEPSLEPEVGSLREIFRYALYSPYYTPQNLKAIQEWDLEKRFRQIPGVIGVTTEGGPTKAYQVAIDPFRLKGLDITLQETVDALANSNDTTGGNTIDAYGEAYIVRGLGLLKNMDDIASVVIKTRGDGIPIHISDVAQVTEGHRVRRGQAGLDDQDDIVQGIVLLRRGENPSMVLDRIKHALPSIQAQLPKGVTLVPIYDRSHLIHQTLFTVSENMALGIVLVMVLLGFFFLDIRFALMTACVIPLSVLFAFISLKALGVPANLLSLGAIDFGILVDCTIMMTESIVRKLSEHRGETDTREKQFLIAQAASEVAKPVVFGISTIIITFLPIFTFQGVEGKLFQPLAITMVTALIGAGVFSLFIIPVISSFWLTRGQINEKHNPLFDRLKSGYGQGLAWAMAQGKLLVLSGVIGLVMATGLFFSLGSEFLPHLEEGNIWLRATIIPGSVSLDESIRLANQVRRIIDGYPEVKKVVSQVGGPDDGTDPHRFADHEYLIDLKPPYYWRPQFHRNKEQLIESLQQDFSQLPNMEFYFTQYIQTTVDESLSGVQGSLVAKIAGPNLSTLEQYSKQVGGLMKQTPGIVDVIVDPLLGQTQISIEIDRDKAARYGLNVNDLAELVEIAIGGKSVTEMIEGERRFDIIVRLGSIFRSSANALEEVWVDTPSGQKIPLAQVAHVRITQGATQIWRESGQRLATIRANVRGRDLASAVADAQQRVDQQVKLPEGYHMIWSGEFQRQQEATRQLLVVMPLTLLVIMGLLLATFRSFKSALVVFCVVPMAAIGGVLALWLTHTHFSIAAGVGFIALFGVAIQNGIFLITHIQSLQHHGQPLVEAVYEGSLTLLRPILLTGLVAIFGLIPAALSNELGSQTQKPFAIVIIGGLIVATLLSLFVLPAFYYQIHQGQETA